ncbi:MAG: hypothetical protein HXY50_13955 [Ignavibacteriaceae bacterium]|nr:hypothetical protein [Ignavibacteriaceae bacterium]
MKYFLSAFFIYVVFSAGCGKDEQTKLEAYNAEAFAYDLGESWEVNATTRVKGFLQKEDNGTFKALLSYEIDLVTPAGDTIKSLISRTEDKIKNEMMSDVDLETQFELDSTHAEGNYKVLFIVKDPNTQQTATSSAEFILEEE